MLVVPADVLRKVPALSSRLAPAPVGGVIAPADRTSKSAPARFVMTALEMKKLPAPVQRIVPPFSSVRPPLNVIDVLSMVSMAPGAMIVRPLPLIIPRVQMADRFTVSVPLPVRAVDVLAPRLRLATSAAVLSVTVTLLLINALSLVLGIK